MIRTTSLALALLAGTVMAGSAQAQTVAALVEADLDA